MIKRPDGLEIIEANIEFSLKSFKLLEIDLAHINKNGRSSYSSLEIREIVTSFINGINLSPSGGKEFGDEFCTYFVKTGEINSEKLKLVFCICSDRPDFIGIITLYRI